MSKDVKNQHYIPQFYLKRFTGENGRFCVYSILDNKYLCRQQPRNFGASRYFYDVQKAELIELMEEIASVNPCIKSEIDYDDEQLIEHYLSRSEADAKNVFDLIDEDYNALFSEEIQQKLIIFLHDLSSRTEFLRKYYSYINNNLIHHLEKMGVPKSKMPVDNAKMTQLHDMFDMGSLYKTANMLKNNYDWFVGNNLSELNFITSDNPVFGVFLGFNDICFPISKKKSIIFRAKNNGGYLISDDVSSDGKTIDLSVKSVLIYNEMLILNAYRYAFGDKNTFDEIDLIRQFLKQGERPKRCFQNYKGLF